MTPIDGHDRESRFEDVCKFAAALVAVGLIVFAGETAMQRIPDMAPVEVPSVESAGAPAAAFSDRYKIDPPAKPEPHIERF